MVIPLLESMSADYTWFSSWVASKRWMKIVKWPAFLRILVTWLGLFGDAATCVVAAAGGHGTGGGGCGTGGCAGSAATGACGAAAGD